MADKMTQLMRRVAQDGGSQDGDGGGGGGGGGDESTGDVFLDLISSPFDSEFANNSFVSALIFSLVLTVAIILAFCAIRPYNSVVYAPRAKHADAKHAPPVVEKGLFGWIKPLMRTKEQHLVDMLGIDAAVFMRFTRMMRNIFSALAALGCGLLIPVHLLAANQDWAKGKSFFTRLTPQYMGGSKGFWAHVIIAYCFTGIVFFFMWTNYRGVLRLRRAYYNSPEFQKSLHARTLLITDIPNEMRSDEGIVRIVEQVKATSDIPRAAIGRNVKDLPDLMEEHEETVRRLEKHLARYLKNPDRLPAKRPTCKANKGDKAYPEGQQVDAIEYLTARIKELELQIKEVRLSVDNRNAMPFGFASYETITAAHSTAFVAAKKGGPEGTLIRLSPKPNDIIWKNLHMLKKQRTWQNFINNLWVALLTVVWVAPNVMIAVFLSNLSHLGQVWPAFDTSLKANPVWWGIAQGILAPAITMLVYYYLPSIFRRLVTNSGDVSRTSRERHVMHKLFSFFLFNNLIVFSLFSAVWGFGAALIKGAGDSGTSYWDIMSDSQSNPFQLIITALITVSPYWCSWLLQRNLGAAIDLSQLARLTWGSFSRRFLSPTPRELIELSAPQPFDYANYYNYFLFYTAVTLCFGAIQPLVLVITALYFWMDSFSKKYLLLYVFITKYESGGMFWRTLYNRMLVCVVLFNLVIALLVVTLGGQWMYLYAMAPIPFVIAGFKWYCVREFDTPIHFYNQGKALADEELASHDHKRRKGDRVGTRFGHPVLYKHLMTPMVAAKSQHLLKSIYSGRTSMEDNSTTAGYSDVYMDAMDASHPGKPPSTANPTPFEFVGENQMDFEHYKSRPEFREQAGGDGALYDRSATPATFMTRSNTWESASVAGSDSGTATPRGRGVQSPFQDSRSASHSRQSSADPYESGAVGGVDYPRGYHMTPSMAGGREQSPAGSEYRQGLVGGAAGMGRSGTPDGGGGTPGGYGMLRLTPGEMGEGEREGEGSYDYFRRQRGL